MTEASMERLKSAFMNAHKAGDVEAATTLAKEIKRRQSLSAVKKKEPVKSEVDYVAADAETDAPTAASMARQRMAALGLAVPAEQTAAAQKVAPGMAREFVSGLTLGSVDELLGGLSGVQSVLTGGDFMPAAQDTMAKFRGQREQFKEKYPKTAIASEIVGSLPTGIASGLKLAATKAGQAAPRLSQALLAGTESAIAGGMGAEGGLKERGEAATVSGVLGLGLGTAGQLLPTGRLMPSSTTKESIDLINEGVPLTVGQQLGGPIAYTENLLGKTLIGDIAGIPRAQRKAFEGFSKNFIQEAVNPIGVKIPKKLDVAEAAKFAEDKISKTFGEAVAKANLPNTKPVEDLMQQAIRPVSLGDVELLPRDIKALRKVLNEEVIERISDGTMTGQKAQAALRELGKSYKKAEYSNEVKQVLRRVKEQLEDILVAQNKGNKDLIKARTAYKNMFSMKAAAKKGRARGAFTPEQAISALESKMPGYMSSPMYTGAQTAGQRLVGSVPPQEGTAGLLTMPKLLTGGGLVAAGTQSVPALAGLASIYRTGTPGAAAAREILATPGYLSRALASAPAIPGMAGGLLAGEQE